MFHNDDDDFECVATIPQAQRAREEGRPSVLCSGVGDVRLARALSLSEAFAKRPRKVLLAEYNTSYVLPADEASEIISQRASDMLSAWIDDSSCAMPLRHAYSYTYMSIDTPGDDLYKSATVEKVCTMHASIWNAARQGIKEDTCDDLIQKTSD